MKRREFITILGGAAMAWPPAALAQPERMRRIGVLVGLAESDSFMQGRLALFRQSLDKLGWSEGRNVGFETRFADGKADRISILAKELLTLRPDVILAQTTPVAAALQRESRTIPIVFVNVADPVGSGLVKSLARPDGNLTGLLTYEAGIVGKWLSILKEISPPIARAGLLANPKTTAFDYFLHAAQAVKSSLGIAIESLPVENATEINRSIESFARGSFCGLILPPDSTTISHRDLIVALAARHRLPTVYALRQFVAAGGLISYGTDFVELFRQAASYVDQILRGAKPVDLPVQAPTKYETTLNLKTAKALGVTVPPALLVAADEVFE